MLRNFSAYLQYCLPHHLLTAIVGGLAKSHHHGIKNTLINWFIKHYQVNMAEALLESPNDYDSFNSFFIRKLKPAIRPISPGEKTLVSPVDGTVAQKGRVNNGQLLQAKNFYYSLETLLAHDPSTIKLDGGAYATFYLAPRDYHRIHMPIDGYLRKSIFVPGQLFSVNKMTSEIIPNLYSRNERLVTLFETPIGTVAIILVGAMIVGSMQTIWMKQAIKSKSIVIENFEKPIFLAKGSELGLFHMGSTVIVVVDKKNIINWQPSFHAASPVQFGQEIATIVSA